MAKFEIDQEKLNILIENPALTKELLRAHLGKPNKVDIFYEAFRKFTVGGIFRYVSTFSMYALCAGIFYFLYRKLYKEAGILFLIHIGISFLSMIVLVLSAVISTVHESAGFIVGFAVLITFLGFLPYIGASMAAKYLYTKKFLRDLTIAGFNELPNDRVKSNLGLLGGFNTWVVVLFVVMLSILLLYFIVILVVVIVAVSSGDMFEIFEI